MSGGGARPVILVVEDNPLNLALLQQILEEHYDLISATDGESGIALAVTHRPDLMLMDLSLPRLDGWAATRILRQHERTREIPIVAVTAHAGKADADQALEAGCNAVVTKPIDEDFLLATIRTYITPR